MLLFIRTENNYLATSNYYVWDILPIFYLGHITQITALMHCKHYASYGHAIK